MNIEKTDLASLPESQCVNLVASSFKKYVFANPTESLSTRYDVMYKWIFRDLRRYFIEEFKAETLVKDQDDILEERIVKYVENRFNNATEDDKRYIVFYLRSTIRSKWNLTKIVKLKITQNEYPYKEIRQTGHYRNLWQTMKVFENFSLKGMISFFENKYFKLIFEDYSKGFDKRCASSKAFTDNFDHYKALLKFINE